MTAQPVEPVEPVDLPVMHTNNPNHVLTLLARHAQVYGARPAIESIDGTCLTYSELFNEVSQLTQQLYSPEHHRIAVVAPNGYDMSLALLVSMCAGVAVPLNPAYTVSEYTEYFRIARIDTVLYVGSEQQAVVEAAKLQGLRLQELGQLRSTSRTQRLSPALPPTDPTRLALLMLTSGSTGQPKVVPLTHHNICASARDVCLSIALGPEDRCLCMWEQFHIGGVVDLLLAPLNSGGLVIAAGSFDVVRFFDLLASRRPTWFQGVPATVHEAQVMAQRTHFEPVGTSLRLIRCVAAALPESWRLEAEQTFRVPVVRTFGMTEASPLITSTSLRTERNDPGSVGFSCGPEIQIKDSHGQPVPTGSIGEVAIRGENVFAGYEGAHELNLECIRGGWFFTGDLGYLGEDSQLFLTGRVKDIINRGGEKISPAEVEAVFQSHPDVEEAVAFAHPHKTLGHDVGIAIIMREGKAGNRQQLEEFAATRLSRFKLPKAWLFASSLPRSAVGKILRNELSQLYLQQQALRPVREPVGQDELAQGVLDIWRQELDSPTMEPTDDFFDMGGDSLSSLRITVAIEEAIGISLAADFILRCHTAAEMADALRKMGVSFQRSLQRTQSASLQIDEDDLILGEHISAESAGLLGYSVGDTRTSEALRHALGALTTPAELLQLFSHRPSHLEFWRASLKSPVKAFRLKRQRRVFRESVFSGIKQARRPEMWARTKVNDHAYLFARAGHLPGKTRLIVAFTGSAMRLVAPIYHVLCALDPDRDALLILRDPWRAHFERGLPGVGQSIEEVADWLRDSALVSSYGDVVALGTSAGAVPALIAFLRNKWRHVLVAGGDDPARHPRLQAALDRWLAENSPTSEGIVIAYSGQNLRDQEGAQSLAKRLPLAQVIADPRFKQHTLFHQLQIRGELNAFLSANLPSKQ